MARSPWLTITSLRYCCPPGDTRTRSARCSRGNDPFAQASASNQSKQSNVHVQLLFINCCCTLLSICVTVFTSTRKSSSQHSETTQAHTGQTKPGQKSGVAKDAVQELEIQNGMDRDGLPSITHPLESGHTMSQSWLAPGTLPRLPRCMWMVKRTRVSSMSYTVDRDPRSTGFDWWGITYVKTEEGRINPQAN
eukprot:6471434-Amphidinium_carterae.1